jgi:hypothetical protein
MSPDSRAVMQVWQTPVRQPAGGDFPCISGVGHRSCLPASDDPSLAPRPGHAPPPSPHLTRVKNPRDRPGKRLPVLRTKQWCSRPVTPVCSTGFFGSMFGARTSSNLFHAYEVQPQLAYQVEHAIQMRLIADLTDQGGRPDTGLQVQLAARAEPRPGPGPAQAWRSPATAPAPCSSAPGPQCPAARPPRSSTSSTRR